MYGYIIENKIFSYIKKKKEKMFDWIAWKIP